MAEDFQWVNLTCQVECFPLCNIEWLFNQQKISGGDLYVAVKQPALDDTDLFKDYEVMTSSADESEYTAESDGVMVAEEELITDEHVEPFLLYAEEVAPDRDNLQFGSLRSTLAIQLGNISQEILDAFQRSNFTCLSEDNEIGPAVEAVSMLTIYHMPLEVSLSTEEERLVVAEEDTMDPLGCSAEAVPVPQIVWKKDGDEISEGEELSFDKPASREMSGEYSCEAKNQLGSIQKSVFIDVQYAPECMVTMTDGGEEGSARLKCSAIGNPEDFMFFWYLGNTTLDGQLDDGASYISVNGEVNDTMLSEYSCMVNNTLGESLPCYINAQGSMLSVEPTSLLIIIILVVVAIALLLAILLYIKCCRKKPAKGENGEGVTKNGTHPKSDNSFYDNLPFHGLKNPPKQVLTAPDDGMVYADVDAQDTFNYGPLAYKTASLQRAKQKKLQEADESKV